MYIVIVGAGDIGTPLIEIATAGGNEVVVVERDPARAEQASREFDCLVINDDATSKETLADAGADRADAIISTTDQDATNIMVCLLAQELEVPEVAGAGDGKIPVVPRVQRVGRRVEQITPQCDRQREHHRVTRPEEVDRTVRPEPALGAGDDLDHVAVAVVVQQRDDRADREHVEVGRGGVSARC